LISSTIPLGAHTPTHTHAHTHARTQAYNNEINRPLQPLANSTKIYQYSPETDMDPTNSTAYRGRRRRGASSLLRGA
jgi:hypothetical protein